VALTLSGKSLEKAGKMLNAKLLPGVGQQRASLS
jgi:hypothetical protein